MRFGMACTDIGGLKVDKKIVYTADDEEPNCGRCDHVVDNDKWCMKHCGGANSWNGYERTEYLGGGMKNENRKST